MYTAEQLGYTEQHHKLKKKQSTFTVLTPNLIIYGGGHHLRHAFKECMIRGLIGKLLGLLGNQIIRNL